MELDWLLNDTDENAKCKFSGVILPIIPIEKYMGCKLIFEETKNRNKASFILIKSGLPYLVGVNDNITVGEIIQGTQLFTFLSQYETILSKKIVELQKYREVFHKRDTLSLLKEIIIDEFVANDIETSQEAVDYLRKKYTTILEVDRVIQFNRMIKSQNEE